MRKKIVLVDDEVELLEVLGFYFEQDEWSVKIASNGKEALKHINSFRPHVIISDINMPELDGLSMIDQLRKNGSNTPVILVSGYRDLEKMRKALSAQVYEFLDKPYDQEKLLAVANKAYESTKEPTHQEERSAGNKSSRVA